MAAGVRANIALSFDATLIGTNDLGSPKLRVLIDKALGFIPGTAAVGEANILFADTRAIAASANEDLDLAGVLTNAFGATITAAEVVAILFVAADTNTNSVQVKAAASNGFTGPFLAAGDGVAIKPGEWQLFASGTGWPVTAATGDLINVANSGAGTGVTYDVVIIGRTAAA